MVLIGAIFVLAVVFGLLGRWVADQCGRSGAEGFWLGFLFGPLGVIVEALLPKQMGEFWRSKGWTPEGRPEKSPGDWRAKGWSGPA